MCFVIFKLQPAFDDSDGDDDDNDYEERRNVFCYL